MLDSPVPSSDGSDRRNCRGVSVLEAARLLGTTPDSVRARLRRRSLEGYRDNAGRWRVVLPDRTGDGSNRLPTEQRRGGDAVATVGDSQAELIAELRVRIEDLRAALEVERERVDRLMAALAERPRPPERRPWPGLKAWWRRVWEGEGKK